jgi:hypothetical protein
MMKIAVAAEIDAGEPRVAATPETVKKMLALGAEVAVEPGAGIKSGILDQDFAAAGANVTADAVSGADIILKVRRPQASELSRYKKGAIVIAIMDPFGHDEALRRMADAGVIAFAMELLPRVTRAQVMDVLSSQANLAGYRAVIDAAAEYGRALPMMMTAAGTVPATKVFIMGAGVAGLQAIATARRLGAIVTATDVRPAAKEQVESLGAKFIAVEDDEFRAAETALLAPDVADGGLGHHHPLKSGRDVPAGLGGRADAGHAHEVTQGDHAQQLAVLDHGQVAVVVGGQAGPGGIDLLIGSEDVGVRRHPERDRLVGGRGGRGGGPQQVSLGEDADDLAELGHDDRPGVGVLHGVGGEGERVGRGAGHGR